MFGIVTGRFVDLVPVWAIIALLLQNIITASGAQTAYCTRGTGGPSSRKAGGGLNLTFHFHPVAR